jgi:hypothetical protein
MKEVPRYGIGTDRKTGSVCDFGTTTVRPGVKEGRQSGWSTWEVIEKRLLAEEAGNGRHGGIGGMQRRHGRPKRVQDRENDVRKEKKRGGREARGKDKGREWRIRSYGRKDGEDGWRR